MGARRAAGVPAGSPQALYHGEVSQHRCPAPVSPGRWGGRVPTPPGGAGTAAAVCGCRGTSCQQLLARGERLPGSPARCHLVFISFPKSLLLRGDARLRWGGGPAPHCSLCGSPAAGGGGVDDPSSHPKNAHGGLWGHRCSAPSPKTRGLVLWGGGAAPPKLVSGCGCRPHPKSWSSQSCWSPESPRVAWATAGRMGRCRAAVAMEMGRAVALVMAPIHPAPKGAGGGPAGPGGCWGR